MDAIENKRVRGTGWKSVYDTLRSEILALTLQPGQLLDETTLAERFDMSRSPVREALIRLAGEELVVTLANRSPTVNAGSGIGLGFSAERLDGFDDTISIEVSGLPRGYSLSVPLAFEAGHNDARAVLSAAIDAAAVPAGNPRIPYSEH